MSSSFKGCLWGIETPQLVVIATTKQVAGDDLSSHHPTGRAGGAEHPQEKHHQAQPRSPLPIMAPQLLSTGRLLLCWAVFPTSVLLPAMAALGGFRVLHTRPCLPDPGRIIWLQVPYRETWDFQSLHLGPLEWLNLALPSTPTSGYLFL